MRFKKWWWRSRNFEKPQVTLFFENIISLTATAAAATVSISSSFFFPVEVDEILAPVPRGLSNGAVRSLRFVANLNAGIVRRVVSLSVADLNHFPIALSAISNAADWPTKRRTKC